MALPLSYNVRNVRVRWQVTLLAISGIALVVAVFAVLMSMSEGFKAALRSTGRPDNAIVVQRGSSSELTSGVPLADRNMIVVDERVARDASGQPLASWELVVVIGAAARERRPAGQRHAARGHAARLRGARRDQGRRGPQLHAGARRGDRGPQAARAASPGSRSAATSSTSRSCSRSSGLFESEGAAFESEIWGDFDTFSAIFQRGAGSNSLVLRMKDPAAIPELDRFIRAQPQMQLQALSERKYYEEQAGPLAKALRGLANFVAMVMGIGAVFGAINTMYAIVASRTREIGTLRALGFSRRSILASFLIESVILALDRRRDRLPARVPDERLLDRHRPDPELQRDRLQLPDHAGDRAGRAGLRGRDGDPGRPAAGAARRAAADHLGAAGGVASGGLGGAHDSSRSVLSGHADGSDASRVRRCAARRGLARPRRQADADAGAVAAAFRLDPDLAAVDLDDALHEREADARALDARVQPLEQAEHPLLVLRVDPDAVVAHEPDRPARVGPRADHDPRAAAARP